jgi:hypothetical protein
MQIRQVSAALDLKLAQLDQQLKKLEQDRNQADAKESATQIDQDILALQKIRAKLVKSKDIAWRAHQLQSEGDEQQRARQRMIGLSLCAISVIGAGLLLLLVVTN